MVRVSGIDVSSFQRNIDWPVVRRTQTFAVLRATRGSTTTIDSRFHEYAAGAAAAGIPYGAYHFGWPDRGAAEQAEWFAETIAGYPMVMPPVLDLETSLNNPSRFHRDSLTKSQRTQWAVDFVEHFQDITGKTPMLYMSGYYAQDWLLRSSVLEALPMWVAHFTTGTPITPRGWTKWHIHQWTDKRPVAGSQGNSAGATDLNWADSADIDELIALNAPQPEPEPEVAPSLSLTQNVRIIRARAIQARDRSQQIINLIDRNQP